VSRYTFHIVWLLVFVGLASAIFGRPLWAYPIVILLSLIAAAAISAYPTDRSLRRTLACFGGFLGLAASRGFLMEGLAPIVLHESLPVLLWGVACGWAALFPYREVSAASR
jgi:hypothetical protein